MQYIPNKVMSLMEFFNSDTLPNQELSLGQKRINMPQVHTNEFLKDIENHPDMNYTKDVVDTDLLLPTQSQFNNNKVSAIILGLRSGSEPKSIIVSKDNYIVDGHHRWAAHNNIGTPVPVIRVNHDIESLLNFLKDKPYVQNKSLVEHNEAKKEIGVDPIKNMKRQLIDLMRLRIQKASPESNDAYSDMLAKATSELLNMSDEDIKRHYEDQVVNNNITPYEDD